MRLSPLNQRRWANFRANRRGWWSARIFLVLFGITLFAEFIANDRPLLVRYEGRFFVPVLFDYDETEFGGDLMTLTDFKDPLIVGNIAERGWAIWPLIENDYRSQVRDLGRPSPAPPSARAWLGTDDQARDFLARLIYGFRIGVLFGFTLTLAASAIGVVAGAVQGYYGGAIDLFFQRFIEIWSGLPVLYMLIILSSFIVPGFWVMFFLLLLFMWTSLVGVVRAEFLRARNFDFVRAAKALGVSDTVIMFRHVLPNAMVATVTNMPFILAGSLTILAALDFLGFGLPPGSPSLGEMALQGKNNLQAPWLAATSFIGTGAILLLLTFTGEAVRDAFDPRKLPGGLR
jgi:microcin C transport system permease protein